MKCAVIAAMVLIARPSDLAALSMGGLTFAQDLSTLRVDLLGFKNDYRRKGAVLKVQACSDQWLCFIRTARALVDANRSRWPAASALFLHSRSGAPLSAERISAVLRGACKFAGLPDTFSGRNFRPGGATRGIEGNLPLDLVMHIGRWRDHGTVYGHYLRSATAANTTDILLGVGRSDPALDAT